MAEWQFWLFGSPRLAHNGRAVPIRRRKQWALLSYLLLTAHPAPRELLAALLWPAYSERQAHADLRRELSRLRGAAPGLLRSDLACVAVETDKDIWLDVEAFKQHCAMVGAHSHDAGEYCATCYEHLLAARLLYVGDLLAGLKVRNSPEFEEWLFFQQDSLREGVFDVLNRLALMNMANQDLRQAIACTRELLALDPLYEEGHQRLMWLYARTGRRSAAVRQYRTCAAVLSAELQAKPSEATRALLAQIASAPEAFIVISDAWEAGASPGGRAGPDQDGNIQARSGGHALQSAQRNGCREEAMAGDDMTASAVTPPPATPISDSS